MYLIKHVRFKFEQVLDGLELGLKGFEEVLFGLDKVLFEFKLVLSGLKQVVKQHFKLVLQ